MTLVVDASVAFSWVFRNSHSDAARALLRTGHRLVAPDLIVAEVANAAWKAVRFSAFETRAAAEAFREAIGLLDQVVPSRHLGDRALDIAIEIGHPVYDCFYLALCEDLDLPLATFDDRLRRRCESTPYAALFRPLP